MTLITPEQLERANQVLGDWIEDKDQFPLGDACRGIDQPRHRLGFDVTRRLVGTLLRKRGFRAAGSTGVGYDRDTLYRIVTPADIAATLSRGQRSTILGLDDTPYRLGCGEPTARRLAKPSDTRPALVVMTRGDDGMVFALNDLGLAVKASMAQALAA